MPSDPAQSSTARWREAFAIVERWDVLGPAERQRAQVELAATDASLYALAQRLIQPPEASVDAAASPLIDKGPVPDLIAGAGTTAPLGEAALAPGSQVGAYTLEKTLGVGGMAVVWLARRSDQSLNRLFALKLPLAVVGNDWLAERFRRERDMLASLDHPNIAKIFDAGVTAQGRPFLALEYVEGEALSDYCKSHRLGLRERLSLVIAVARAVHHAHSRLVLHRDLKPSNILVTAMGEAKVLDFGIAKLLNEERTAEETQFTLMTGAALTPKYAAPEQMLGQTVSTSTDTYALAVIAFELLTGRSPFEGNAKEYADRLARLDALPLSLVAAAEHGESDSLRTSIGLATGHNAARTLWADVSAVLTKALRRAPEDRYDSAQSFADDLQSALDNRPVAARQGARWYRVRKFLERNALPLGLATAGIVIAGGLGVQALLQAQRAAQSQSRAESIDGLLDSFFKGMSPDVAKSRTFTAKELLDRASGFLSESGDGASAHPSTYRKMSALYWDIGDSASAVRVHEKQLASSLTNRDVAGQIEARVGLCLNQARLREFSNADLQCKEAERQIALLPPGHFLRGQLQNARGQWHLMQGQNDEAFQTFKAAETFWRGLNPIQPRQLIWAVEGQAMAMQSAGQLSMARKLYQDALGLDRDYPVRGETERLEMLGRLGVVSLIAGRYAESAEHLKPICQTQIERLGLDHVETLLTCRNRAIALVRSGDSSAAMDLLLRLRTDRTPSSAIERGRIDHLEALAQMYRGDARSAEPLLRRFEALLAADPASREKPTSELLRVRRHLAESEIRQDRFAEACPNLIRVRDELIRRNSAHNADVAVASILAGVCALHNGQRDQGASLMNEAASTLRQIRGEGFQLTLVAQSYALGLSGETKNEQIATLKQRLQVELGWQAGTKALVKWLEMPQSARNANKIPIVL